MSTRMDHFQAIPTLTKALVDLTIATGKSSLDPIMKSLIGVRASQINACAFCLDMHTKQAKMKGERELRLYHVAIWRESPLFTAKEKAALALTEALTTIVPSVGVNDELYSSVKEHFSDVEISELTFAIAIINMWNRLQIVSQVEPGSQDAVYGLTKAGLT